MYHNNNNNHHHHRHNHHHHYDLRFTPPVFPLERISVQKSGSDDSDEDLPLGIIA